jgi:hypothetical protein
LKNQLKTELNNSETKVYFVNKAKIKGLNCNRSTGKIKKKKRISMNKGLIDKFHNFRGDLKLPYQLRNKTAPFLKPLFITIFITRRKPIQQERRRNGSPASRPSMPAVTKA